METEDLGDGRRLGVAPQRSGGLATAATGPAISPAVLEAPLTRMSVGMWGSRHHRACQLLLLPAEQQLVVVVDRRSSHPRSPSRFSLAAVKLAAKSPFASRHSAYRTSGCVHAFEVPFGSIRGIDYSNPLCHEARLVLETVGLRQREFPTLEAAREYFLHPTRQAQPCPVTSEGAPPAGGSRSGSGGLLQAALQAQAAAGAGAGAAPAAAGVDALPAAAGGDEEAGSSQCCGSSAGCGSGAHGAKGSLLMRPDAGQSSRAALLGALDRSQSAPIGETLSPAPAMLATRAGGGELSPWGRTSFDSYESDPGSPASGSLWYWGSPASTAYLSPAAAAPAAAGDASPGMPCRTSRGRCSGDGSSGSWEDLGGVPISSHNGGVPISSHNGGVPISSHSGGAGGFDEAPWVHPQRHQEPLLLQQPRTQHSRPIMHAGSAPSTNLLVGSAPTPSLLSTSPPARHAAAWRRQTTPVGGASEPGSTGLHRVASEGQLHSARGGRPGGVHFQDAQAGEEGWPAAHAFTTVTKVYPYRTVVLHWTDARLPGMLRPIIQGNERLLRLHESGLPAWAVYAPQYGLYYRPWLRKVTWIFFYAFSAFSFAVGFYDLYKSIPGLQLVMQRLMASVWLPPGAVLEWLEQHTQIRLSILLTYLFGKSEAFVWFMRWAQHFVRLARAAVQPVADVLGPPLAMLANGLSAIWLTLAAILQAGLAPIAALLLECWAMLGAALLPVMLLMQHLVTGPFVWLASGLRQLCVASGAVGAVISQAAASLAAAVAALAGTAKAGRAVGGATSQVIADQALWLYIIPADALEVLRTSAVKAAKAAQAVAKFCLQICDNVVRHRLTLGLRAQRAWRRIKGWLHAAAMAPLRLAMALVAWLAAALRLLLLDRLAGHGQAAQEQQGEEGTESSMGQQVQHQEPQLHAWQQQQQQPAGEECAAGSGAFALGLRHRAAAGGWAGPEGDWSDPTPAPAAAVLPAAVGDAERPKTD